MSGDIERLRLKANCSVLGIFFSGRSFSGAFARSRCHVIALRMRLT